jgi:mono/diheme cytochrome c family protein
VTSARIALDATFAPVRRSAILLCVLTIAGCGGSDGTGSSGGSGAAKTGGRALFAGTCGTCHTLSDAGTSGTFGPNLDELKPDQARVEKAIATGPGAMPENLFEGAQAKAVATYVAGAAGK